MRRATGIALTGLALVLMHCSWRSVAVHVPRFSVFAFGGPRRRERNNAQVDCCCWLCRSRRNFGASNNACADSSVGRYDHAGSLRMRPGQDPSWWCLRGQNHNPPYPPNGPQGLPEGLLLSMARLGLGFWGGAATALRRIARPSKLRPLLGPVLPTAAANSGSRRKTTCRLPPSNKKAPGLLPRGLISFVPYLCRPACHCPDHQCPPGQERGK
jgi:hypothetical protein